jgi:hypothetical protein
VQKPDGTWDFDRVLAEADFECIHCHKLMGVEQNKRWMNDRSRRRWRRTNLSAEPYHISFTVSDFLSYLVTIGELAVKYIKTKGDPVARQGYRNHHEGKPYELRETKTEAGDSFSSVADTRAASCPGSRAPSSSAPTSASRIVNGSPSPFARPPSSTPKPPSSITGKNFPPMTSAAFSKRGNTSAPRTEKNTGSPLAAWTKNTGSSTSRPPALNRPAGRLKPTAGIAAELSIRSISFNQHPSAPKGFGIISYVDRDAKHDLYTARIGSWVIGTAPAVRPWPISSPKSAPSAAHCISSRSSPTIPRAPHAEFLNEWTKEHLVEVPGAHSAKQFVWKRKGPNHWADAAKVALVIWRFFVAQ